MDQEYIERSKVDNIVNPKGVCWVCGNDGLHQECSEIFVRGRRELESETAKNQEKRKLLEQKKLNEYSVSGRFGLRNDESCLSYEKAKNLVEQFMDMGHAYDESRIVEGNKFWYVPFYCIGLTGYIVEKNSNKIFPLGSGLGDFWSGIEKYLACELDDEALS